MSSPKRRIETDVSALGTKAHTSGYEVDVLIINFARGIGDEVSGASLQRPSAMLTLLQDVRHSYFSSTGLPPHGKALPGGLRS